MRQIHLRNCHHHKDTCFRLQHDARIQFLPLPCIEEEAKAHGQRLAITWLMARCCYEPDIIETIAYRYSLPPSNPTLNLAGNPANSSCCTIESSRAWTNSRVSINACGSMPAVGLAMIL